jgi:hypothetical protein
MCTRCGRPQPARKGNCMACGEVLPDAPLPAPQDLEAPFLSLEGSGGRAVSGADRRLTYREGTAATLRVVELGGLQTVMLCRRLFLEALVLVPIGLILGLVAPSLRPEAAVLSGLGLLVTGLWRRYFLALKARDGENTQWPLGVAFIGSDRARRLDAAWSSGATALASRGVAVQDAPGAPGPGA